MTTTHSHFAPDPSHAGSSLRARIIGVGGAGLNAVEHAARLGLEHVSLAAVDTNARELERCAVSNRLLVGRDRCHGLGTGGDAEIARVMAEADQSNIESLAADAGLLFLLTGMGGGTGTGVAPVVARAARQSGALVLAIAIMPFEFEGPKRRKQAQLGLQVLRASADAVISLSNEKTSGWLEGNATVIDVFGRVNELLARATGGLLQMLARPGLIKVDFAYLRSVLRGRHTESALACAEAAGGDRASSLVAQILAHPLLEGGRSLLEADHVLASLAGPPDLSVAEINQIMEGLNGKLGDAELVFGTAVESAPGTSLSLTVLASKYGKPAPHVLAEPLEESPGSAKGAPSAAVHATFLEDAPAPRPAPRFVAPPPESTAEKTRELLEKQSHARFRKGASRWKQEMLALEIVSRGRFEKSEPTIHRGADLDVPTYIRRGIPLN